MNATLAERLDAALPQTQCTRCGYDGCRPYADAIAAGGADVNRCPPGGPETIRALAQVTGREAKPLDPSCGRHGPLMLARIDATRCIGCTLCIDACPVDAILGAPRRMHAVLTAQCTGCELCVAPCPVDCIAMVPADRAWTAPDAADARRRHAQRAARLARAERVAQRAQAVAQDVAEARKAAVTAAIARARARRAAVPAATP